MTVDAQQVRDRIEITVRDHGAGLPPYASDRAFEEFFSTPRPSGKKGTGLGLAFVREIAMAWRPGAFGQSRRWRSASDNFAAKGTRTNIKSSDKGGDNQTLGAPERICPLLQGARQGRPQINRDLPRQRRLLAH